jgi:hypothetical protein
MFCFHVNQAWFMVSAENFMKVLFITYNVVRSYEHHGEHVVAFLNPFNRMGHNTYQLAHYMFAAGCRSDKFKCNHGLVGHTSAQLRSCRYVILRRHNPHFRPVATHNTSVCHIHISYIIIYHIIIYDL